MLLLPILSPQVRLTAGLRHLTEQPPGVACLSLLWEGLVLTGLYLTTLILLAGLVRLTGSLLLSRLAGAITPGCVRILLPVTVSGFATLGSLAPTYASAASSPAPVLTRLGPAPAGRGPTVTAPAAAGHGGGTPVPSLPSSPPTTQQVPPVGTPTTTLTLPGHPGPEQDFATPPDAKVDRPTGHRPSPHAIARTTAAGTPAAPRRAIVRYTVRPGDSLWAIAEQQLRAHGVAASESDIAALVGQLERVNASRLPVPSNPDLLFPGEVLVIPRGTGATHG